MRFRFGYWIATGAADFGSDTIRVILVLWKPQW